MWSPVDLTCEYSVNPTGIDAPNPRFSWRLAPSGRGQMQSAYQILVASSEEKLASGDADLWDSGRIASDKSINVVYGGAPLASNQRCRWSVRVWDEKGQVGDFAPPASFGMGLLHADDWHGFWIGAADRSISSPLLRTEFTLDKPVKRATLHSSGLGYAVHYFNGERVSDHVLDPGNTYYTNDQPFELGSRQPDLQRRSLATQPGARGTGRRRRGQSGQ